MSTSSISELKKLLGELGIKPSKRLGQHFVVDTKILDYMVGLASLSSGERVLEIGAGIGNLTELLSEGAAVVYAVELDRKLYRYLVEKFRGVGSVIVIHGDALKLDLPHFDKVVSNLPFSIATPFTIKLLTQFTFTRAVLTYQKEVALRLVAKPGSDSYGRLSVIAQLFANISLSKIVPRTSFYPAPEVDAAIVLITPKSSPIGKSDLPRFEKLVAALFSQRRRFVAKALKNYFNKIEKRHVDEGLLLDAIKGKQGKRVYELEPAEILDLYSRVGALL